MKWKDNVKVGALNMVIQRKERSFSLRKRQSPSLIESDLSY